MAAMYLTIAFAIGAVFALALLGLWFWSAAWIDPFSLLASATGGFCVTLVLGTIVVLACVGVAFAPPR